MEHALLLSQAAYPESPRDDKKHREKKQCRDSDPDVLELYERPQNPESRSRTVQRDGHVSWENSGSGEQDRDRDRKKSRERKKETRERDREKRKERRELEAARGRSRDWEHHGRKEELLRQAVHHSLGWQMLERTEGKGRSGECWVQPPGLPVMLQCVSFELALMASLCMCVHCVLLGLCQIWVSLVFSFGEVLTGHGWP